MPERGILFDHLGNMSAIEVDDESVLSELYEHIGCRVVVPLFICTGVNLWVDAEGADNGQKLNTPLSKTADTLGGLDTPIYGPGVFLGCDQRGEGQPVTTLSNDNWEAIVMAQIRNVRAELRTTNH
jgi:hypothetical protein